MMVIVAILCIIGVVLWITVGAVVSNLPDDSKFTSFPFQSSKISLHGDKSNDDVSKTSPTHIYRYNNAIAKSGIFRVC